ncbi:DNA phosphorothioation-associated protein 4 [Trichocoleus sp. DQ-U1]|uniref:DNA phosphorothioation-associated protein 4 n=1 Tax=Trichocoleus sp. DQ-U1 TaxID=2933926 RepID=UPI003296CDEA
MGANRIRIAKDKADLVQGLVASDSTTGPFQTYADAIAFAAALGAKRRKRSPLGEISKREPGAIALEVFVSRGTDRVIQLLSIAETKDIKILSPTDENSEEQRIRIFEEYANGGLEIIQDELRGTVNYTERLLLILISDKFKEELGEDSFDLRKFL